MSSTLAKRKKPLSKKHALRAAESLQQARTLLQSGQLQQAEMLCLSILEKYPNQAEVLHLLGIIAQHVNRFDIAITRFQQTLSIKPNFAEAHYNLGIALQLSGEIKAAIHHYKQAISIKPNYAMAHNNLGSAHKILGRYEDAIYHYKKTIDLKPDCADAHNNIGMIYQDIGQKEKAIEHYEQTLKLKSDFAKAYYNLSTIQPKQEYINTIQNLLSSTTSTDEQKVHYHHALANIFNNAKDYSSAFEHAQLGNAIKRKTVSYDSNKHSELVNGLIETFTEKFFKEKNDYGSDSELPIFILGMPRSGTTLVEQIISSHSEVYGAGELTTLADIEFNIAKYLFESSSSYPQGISSLDNSLILKFSNEYLDEIVSFSTEATRIIDKMPFNFCKIGLIKLLFPKARIIHCQRNALDTCISIFLNYFTEGNEYSFDLTEIGHYYLDYERIMAHWHRLFPNEIFDVKYEDLVNDQENISRQLIKYVGLEWDEACIDFHKNKRAVKTASNSQVRQPIYNKSIERWKRYEGHLQPLIDVLQK